MNHTPAHHHVILWTGVIVFTLLIGAFWVMGLPDMFKNAPTKTSFSDTANAWERVRAQADDMIELVTKQNQAATARDAQTSQALKEQLKQMLSTTTVAAPIEPETAATSTATTTIE
ncbi:MAG: hypothetical protein AAB633_03060 [Patescibacteria group bacterium]